MKKSELTQLTQIIEHIVAREVRKQLPGIITEVFQNGMSNKPVLAEKQQPKPVAEPIQEAIEKDDLKSSLKELFAGVTRNEAVASEEQQQPQAAQPKQYTKNPVLNQILNETVGDIRQRDRLVGAAAFQGGYSMTPVQANPMQPPVPGGRLPMEAIPQGVSVLDVAKAGMVPKPVTEALTNYSRMKAVLDASKKRR